MRLEDNLKPGTHAASDEEAASIKVAECGGAKRARQTLRVANRDWWLGFNNNFSAFNPSPSLTISHLSAATALINWVDSLVATGPPPKSARSGKVLWWLFWDRRHTTAPLVLPQPGSPPRGLASRDG